MKCHHDKLSLQNQREKCGKISGGSVWTLKKKTWILDASVLIMNMNKGDDIL